VRRRRHQPPGRAERAEKIKKFGGKEKADIRKGDKALIKADIDQLKKPLTILFV
jgi:hypothetical protein